MGKSVSCFFAEDMLKDHKQEFLAAGRGVPRDCNINITAINGSVFVPDSQHSGTLEVQRMFG
jgi:hypothetical protein